MNRRHDRSLRPISSNVIKRPIQQLKVILLAVLCIGIAASSLGHGNTVPARGQENMISNPRVIASTPAAREIVGTNAQVEIIFDQPMDRASVEANFATSLPTGSFQWMDDSRVTYKPGSALKRGDQFSVRITDKAQSKTGLPLEETFSLQFQVSSYLTVTQVVPAANAADVKPDAIITVVFDRPVVPLVNTSEQDTLPNPLTFTPAINGKGEWLSTAIFTFTPDTAFAGGTTYTVQVDPNLKDIEGVPLNPESGTYSWSFSTARPQLLSISPYAGSQGNALESVITITFNQPMDVAATSAAISVQNISNGESVPGRFTVNGDGSVFTFTPDSKLALESNYRVTVTGAAKSASGEATVTNPTGSEFATAPYPRVRTTYPANGTSTYAGAGIQIEFNTRIEPESVAGKITVEPKLEQPIQINAYDSYVYVNFPTDPGSTYTVTIAPGIKDVYGNVINEPYTFTFFTNNSDPMLEIARRDYNVGVTSAYRPVTSLAAAGVNVNSVEVSLTRVPDDQVLSLPLSNGYFDIYTYAQRPLPVTRTFTVQTNAEKNRRFNLDIPLAEDGKALPPGVYYVQIDSPDFAGAQYRRDPIRYLLIVSQVQIVSKTTPSGTTVWVTDLKTGQPRANVAVTLNRFNTGAKAEATTDANGIAVLEAIPSAPGEYYNTDYFSSRVDNQLIAFSSSNWQDGLNPYEFNATSEAPRRLSIYTHTDQSIYRPDRPVYFRGMIRYGNDTTYTIPAGVDYLPVRIVDPNGKVVYEQRLPVSTDGTFNGSYTIPLGVPLGAYSIITDLHPSLIEPNGNVKDADYTVNQPLVFQVAEYRPPEFLVNATANASEVKAGETIEVTFDAKFLFGGAVSGATVNWTATATESYFDYKGVGNYQFGENSYFWWYRRNYAYFGDFGGGQGGRTVGSGSGVLAADGTFKISVPADLAGSLNPQDFLIEASVTDVSNQTVAGRTSVLVHPADVYVGVSPESYIGKANEPQNFNIITVNPASAVVPNQKVDAVLSKRTYEQDATTLQWTEKLTEVDKQSVTTGADGKAVLTVTPKDAGSYELRLTSRDGRERLASTVTTLYVQGPNSGDVNPNSRALTLVTDKHEYVPGDTAQILIASPFPETVKALVTVERAGIMKTDIIDVQGSVTYSLPLETIHAPNVFVSVVIARGGDGVSQQPDLRYGLAQLNVRLDKRLNITITPSEKLAQPGKAIRFDVVTTDEDGNPVAANVGVSMTDVATLSVGAPNSAPIYDFFWSPRGLAVITAANWVKGIDDLTSKNISVYGALEARSAAAMPTTTAAGAAAPQAENGFAADSDSLAQESAGAKRSRDEGQANQANIAPRTNFIDTPLWKPDLITDATGKGSVEVTLPDNLTTWRIDARAIAQDTRAGDGTIDIVSTRPLIVRPATPRFFIVGDEVELATVVNNNTEQDLTTDISLTAKGVDLQGEGTQTVTIKAGDRLRVTWQAKVQDVANVDLIFAATSGEFADASKPAVGIGDDRLLPVYKYLAPDYVATAGVLRQPGSRTEAVLVPNVENAPTGNLTLRLQPSLAAATIDGLDYLKNFPYQCVEQTVSRFLPNILTYRALQSLGIDKPELKQNLDVAIKFALDKLTAEQRADGGWGYFYRDKPDPLTTAWAVFGLLEARKADLLVNQDMLTRAVAFLIANPVYFDDVTPTWERNRAAFVQYVLHMAGSANMQIVDRLYEQRDKLSLYARAYLVQIYATMSSDSQKSKADTLISDLQTAAITSATGTHWEEGYRDWWNWGSDTRSTAIILDALITAGVESDLLPNVVRWLMVARKGTAWETTQETAWSIMALNNWMVRTGELKANYEFAVNVNDGELGKGTASQDNLTDTTTLTTQITEMLRDQINRVTIEHGAGDGALYYTATLTLNQAVEQIKPTNRGLAFTRTYYVDDLPVTEVKVGDIVTVKLDISVENDLYYVNIEDPIPAGVEILDRALQTTAQVGQTPELSRNNNDWYRYGWGWWWFSNTEIRTEKIVLNATYLPRGSYTYVYQFEATTPGTYRVIPPNGQEFYFPEVFGRGAGSLFTVK